MNSFNIKGDKGTTVIGNKLYYYKRNDAYVEMLVEKIADLFGLKHAHYIPITIDGLNYYLSEDLNNQGTFSTAYDLGIDSNSLRDISDSVLNLFPNDFDRLIDDIIKMYFMDLMILNIDRHVSNWGFINKDNKPEICILDNDLSFIWYYSCMNSCHNPTLDSYNELINIFETFPDEYIELFIKMYNTLDCDKLGELVKKTEEDLVMELPYKDNYFNRFSSFREHIKCALVSSNKKLIKTEN